jgi:hypothetical protein
MSDKVPKPVLNELSKPFIVKFHKEYTSFKNSWITENRGKSVGNQESIALVSECLSIELRNELWRRLVVNQDMVEADVSEEIFDELVQDFLDSLVSQETFSEAIIWFGKNIAGKLKLNPNNPNPAGKVVTYCATLQGLLAEAGIDKEDVNKDPQKFGQVVRTLISVEGVLDPPEIRAWFKHLMEMYYLRKVFGYLGRQDPTN